jgi:hypothetical protein
LNNRCKKHEAELTAEGVKVSSVLKTAPGLRSQRISATYPAPTSKTLPEASGPSGWVTAATKGATNAGYGGIGSVLRLELHHHRLTLRFASISGGMIVSVIADAANCCAFSGYSRMSTFLVRTGAIHIALMLYLTPSAARAFVKATRPIFAAL